MRPRRAAGSTPRCDVRARASASGFAMLPHFRRAALSSSNMSPSAKAHPPPFPKTPSQLPGAALALAQRLLGSPRACWA
jgi:hypothetical protein